jgi:hypothetical protein
MRDVAAVNVRITTLYPWHERCRTDPQWRPSHDHLGENRRVFSYYIEAIFAYFIHINFAELGRPPTRATLQPLILILVQDLMVQGILNDAFLNLICPGYFLSWFLDRIGLNFRRARPARRPMINDEECAHFLAELTAAYYHYPPHLILNFDESNWHLMMTGTEVVAERGAESVHQYLDGGAKANFSFFATTRSEGEKLPLILIAKGKTH